MNPIFQIESENIIKLFNTISHIIYYEINGTEFTTLRRNVVDLDSDRRKIYEEHLKQEIPSTHYGKNFYKIFIPNKYFKESFNASDIGYGTHIYITFIDIENVDVYYKEGLFINSNSEIHLLVPLSMKNTDISISNKIEYIQDIFKYILFFFAGIKLNSKCTVYNANMNNINKYVAPLVNIFANIIMDDENAPSTILDIVNNILENSTDSNSKYIKINTNLNFEEILRLYGN